MEQWNEIRRRVLASVTGSPGQSRYSEDRLAALVGFNSGKKAVLHVRAGSDPELVAITDGLVAALPGIAWKTFGVPTVGPGGSAAFLATIKSIGLPGVPGATNAGIVADRMADLELVARKGSTATGAAGLTFGSFKDPVYNGDQNVAFVGTLGGSGLTSANKTGIWRTDLVAPLALVARAGSTVDGTPDTPTWASFTSLALPDNVNPVFAAKLALNTRMGDNLVTLAKMSGVWADDGGGSVRKVVQLGDAAIVGDSPTSIIAFAMLSTVSGSPAQGRCYNGSKQLIYRVSLRSGLQQIRITQLP